MNTSIDAIQTSSKHEVISKLIKSSGIGNRGVKETANSNLSTQRSRNYKFKVPASNSKANLLYHNTTQPQNFGTTGGVNINSQNFGLGLGVGAGTYMAKPGDTLASAYATNATDLLRGFKSNQSIPIVKNSVSS